MTSRSRQMIFLTLCFMIAMPLFGCQKEKPKKGKVEIVKQQFSMRQENKYNWTIDAKGIVKNVGDVAVKNVVVTGYCESCGDKLARNVWAQYNVEKSPDQKATIAYLPPGAEKDFSFKEIAFMLTQAGESPDKMPDKLDCKIVSFETVQK